MVLARQRTRSPASVVAIPGMRLRSAQTREARARLLRPDLRSGWTLRF